MKKSFLLVLLLGAVASLQAQTNLQVHYDFGKDRKYVTTTLEMFKPDKWGNTFFFSDMDFNYGSDNHASLAYMEIARCINTWGGPFSAHVEFNGGFGGNTGFSYPINNAWLGGVDYSLHNADFSRTLNLKALYKHIVGKQESVQFTAVWGVHLMDRKISLTGFADFWKEDNTYLTTGETTSWTFISEPQFWYNVNSNLSAGSEIELSNNFGGHQGFMVNPTLALKWNF